MDLLERQAQLEELARLLREAATRAGKIVLVSGEAGAGKSALVERCARQAARSARVAWGYSDALQTSRVLGPVIEVAAALLARSDSPHESDLSREPLFSRLFERLSPPNPLSLVVLEDLHWADEATLDFVRFLGRRIQHTRCLLLATYRDDEVPTTHPLRSVLGDLTGPHTLRIDVPALSLAAVEQLARGTARNARKVYGVTGGNAFFVRELLSSPADTVPETVRDAVLARLMYCSADARAVAELVSLAPGKADLGLIRTILGDIGAAADEAVTRGLLRHQGAALAFRHELGRLAVESTVPRARAERLHREILAVLIEHGADLAQLVHHASGAQDVKALLEFAPRAAERAARAGAHRAAVAHLEKTLPHLQLLSAAARAHLIEMHAVECNVTNQVAAALDSANRALEVWRELRETPSQARMLLLIARQYWKSGQTGLADRHVAAAIALLETLPPGRDLAMAYSARSQLAMLSKKVTETREFGQRALDLAAQFDDINVRTHALTNIGTALLYSGENGGLQMLEQSLAFALEHEMQEHVGRAYVNLVGSLVRQRASGLAERYLREGMEYCEVHDVEDCLSYIRSYHAMFDLNRGDWDKAARAATQALELQDGLAVTERLRSLVVLALVRARRGDPGVQPLFDETQRLASTMDELERGGPLAAARAEVAWYRGDLNGVMKEASGWLQAAAGCRDTWILGELAYWGRRADPALPVPAELAEPYALMIEGDWERAAAAWQQLGAPYESALALADGPEEALRESLAILDRLGAGPLTGIVRQRLRKLGARGIPRGSRASTREHPARLTTREVQVLTLLVQGHTNTELAQRLHVSRKTVEHHVSSILEKLAVRSRADVAAAAFGLGIMKGTS